MDTKHINTNNQQVLFFSFCFLMTNSVLSEERFEHSSNEIIHKLSKPINEISFSISGKKTGIKLLKNVTYLEEDIDGHPIKRTILVFTDKPTQNVNIKVTFSIDSYAIHKTSFNVLGELGKALNSPKLQNVSVFIKGHTDSDGDEEYNQLLSYNRAISVKRFLISNYNIDDKRLFSIGYGENLPLVPNTSSDNKEINRRVEIEAR